MNHAIGKRLVIARDIMVGARRAWCMQYVVVVYVTLRTGRDFQTAIVAWVFSGSSRYIHLSCDNNANERSQTTLRALGGCGSRILSCNMLSIVFYTVRSFNGERFMFNRIWINKSLISENLSRPFWNHFPYANVLKVYLKLSNLISANLVVSNVIK